VSMMMNDYTCNTNKKINDISALVDLGALRVVSSLYPSTNLYSELDSKSHN